MSSQPFKKLFIDEIRPQRIPGFIYKTIDTKNRSLSIEVLSIDRDIFKNSQMALPPSLGEKNKITGPHIHELLCVNQ